MVSRFEAQELEINSLKAKIKLLEDKDRVGEGSGTPTEPHHTPSLEEQQTSPTTHSSLTLPPVTTAPIPTVTPSDTPPFRQYTKRTRIAQSSVLPPVADEPVSPFRDGSEEQFGDDAPIKGRRLDEGEEAAERVIDDTKEMATILTFMDATNILTSGGVQVAPTPAEVATTTVSIPSGSGVVSTASLTIPTASPILTTATESTPYTRRKGKETMVESETPKKKKVQEQIDAQVARELEEQMAREDQRMSKQIARDAEVARIHAEEELQMMINSLDMSNETIVKYLQEYEQIPKDLCIRERIELISDLVKYQENYAQVLKYQTLQRKPRSKKQKKDYYMAVIKSHAGWKTKDFKGMSFKQIEEKFNTESVKKLKTSEEVKATEEVSEEKVKEMMQLVPVEEIYVESLQIKHIIIDWKEDLNQLLALVKESLSFRPSSSDKEMELWVELKRLYEPDVEDQLWTHTQNIKHAPVEWKMYDLCRVHHVTYKDNEIFMLIARINL
nr:hypothetical protein [Tanacetum cinerariifolium]